LASHLASGGLHQNMKTMREKLDKSRQENGKTYGKKLENWNLTNSKSFRCELSGKT
jgi:hypothetical protein